MEILALLTTSVLFYLIFLFLAFLVGIAIGKGNYQTKSNTGEAIVRKVLTNHFPSPENHLLNNITIPFEGGSTQIDHILVSSRGIFVIETKHYSGWIFANVNSSHWTQVIYRYKSKFPNPLRQNFKHVKAIQQLFDFIPKEHIHSLVVFTGRGEFRTEIPTGVVSLEGLVEKINSYKQKVLTQNRVQFCVGRIECLRYQISRQTDVEHQAYLKRKFGNS